MRTLNLKGIKSFIVISDVHLRNADDALTRVFIQEIDKINEVDAVFFLGDIFDFIAAPIAFFEIYWKNVFEAFKKLKKRNIQVYFTEGNHDFGFEHFKRPLFLDCFTECGDFEIALSHPVHGNILLKHGDEVICKGTYLPFRYLVKSYAFQKLTTKLFSGAWMHSIFSRFAKLSRNRDNYRILSVAFMNKKIQTFLQTHHADCDVFIMGHIHKDVDQLIYTKKLVRVLIGKAWFDSSNFLRVDEKEICRHSIQ